ncbi:unnamed protein product [Cochlearia groenlandica]
MFNTKTSLLCFFFATVIILTDTTSSTVTATATATDTYIYAVCSPSKFSPSSTYETNLNSLLSSFETSTVTSPYNNLTVPSGNNAKPDPTATVHGLYQCRGDLDPTSCSSCVSRAVTLVKTTCPYAYSGLIQMENCLVRYDNNSVFGVLDKSLVIKKCGPSIGFDDQDALTRVSDVMGSLGSGDGPYRTRGNGDVEGVAQCSGDLSTGQCGDCLVDAIGRLRSECGMAQGGYVYLSKCYARFSYSGSHARQTPNSNFGGEKDNKDNDGIGQTMAIIIGIITLVILLVVFLAFLGKQCRKLQDEKWCV